MNTGGKQFSPQQFLSGEHSTVSSKHGDFLNNFFEHFDFVEKQV